MRGTSRALTLLSVAALSAGCARITTQVVERPRVDQEVQGNQGYLRGEAPPAPARRRTRTVLHTDIEFATAEELNPWRRAQKVEIPPTAATPAPDARALAVPPAERATPASPAWEPQPPEEWERPRPARPAPPAQPPAGESYTVQSGDTLEKISQKFYGTTRKWRRIYEANRNVLKGPDRVYPGQKLVIPPAEEETTDRPAEFK